MVRWPGGRMPSAYEAYLVLCLKQATLPLGMSREASLEDPQPRLLEQPSGSALVPLRDQRVAHTSVILIPAMPLARASGTRAEKQTCVCRLHVLHMGMLRRLLAPMH